MCKAREAWKEHDVFREWQGMWSGEEQVAIRRGTEMPKSEQRPADQQTCVMK